MAVIWWFAGTFLMLLSFVLWLSALAGREGVLRIGKVTVAHSREGPKRDVRLVRLSNAILGLVGILVGLTIILVVVFWTRAPLIVSQAIPLPLTASLPTQAEVGIPE